ncbi:DUF1127 domain-containing protein [Tabrizicola sp.]|uniref:DUF1127 domain-containing protein n=1 Tax=Tabrizicola sp. TaxID=2005166 RepID=UPI0035B2A0AD
MTSFRLALPLAFRPARVARIPGRFLARLIAIEAMARSRRSLARLDDHLLRDIGLTRAEAEAEAEKSAWDSPLHWKG